MVLQGLVPAPDPALGLRVERRTVNVAYGLGFGFIGQFIGDVDRTGVRQKPWPVLNMRLVAARGGQSHIQRVGHVFGSHRAAQPPGDDVAGVIVEHGREIHPAPVDDFEVGKMSYDFASVQLRFRSAASRSPGSSGCGSGLPP